MLGAVSDHNDSSVISTAGDDEMGPPSFECYANSSCGLDFLACGDVKSLICAPRLVSYMVRTEGSRESIGFSRLLSPHYTFEVMFHECSLYNGPQLSTSVVDSIACARFRFQNSRLHCGYLGEAERMNSSGLSINNLR